MNSLPSFLTVPSLNSFGVNVIEFSSLASFIAAFLLAALVVSVLALLRERSRNVALQPSNGTVVAFENTHRPADTPHRAAA